MKITTKQSNVFAIIIAFLLGWVASYVLLLAPEPIIEPSTASVQSVQSEVSDKHAYLYLINQERADRGLDELRLNDKLNTSAQLKANDMKEFDYWAHINPNGTEPWHFFELAGYEYEKAGENLSRCFDTPEQTVKSWMNSPTHKENILGDYSETGLGSYYKGDCLVVVNHFGAGK